MTGADEAAEAGGTTLMPATVAARRRTAPLTRAATLPSSVGSMATTRTPVSEAAALRSRSPAATCT